MPGRTSVDDAWTVFMELNAEWQYRVQVVSNIEELSDGERLEFDNTVRSMYGRRALTKAWYEMHGRNLNPEVVQYVDRLLQQAMIGSNDQVPWTTSPASRPTPDTPTPSTAA